MANDMAMTAAFGLEELDRAWNALQAVVGAADEGTLTLKYDAKGWSAKDHLAHLDAWLNSVLAVIRDGRPQWDGLGIDRALFDEEDVDFKNEVLRQRTLEAQLDDVRSSLAESHAELCQVLSVMTEKQISAPCDEYVPGSGDYPIAFMIGENSFHHYDQHRDYIERILAS